MQVSSDDGNYDDGDDDDGVDDVNFSPSAADDNGDLWKFWIIMYNPHM